MALDVHVVSHTHWDREWYLTREQYRVRLVGLIDRVLERLESDPRFAHFHLDGQTIVLEDYLEVRPEQEARLREHVAAGRLLVGPWYVMPDMHLVSGESLVRNLAFGHRLAARFGRVMGVGYMPDPFGHVAQMPQVLRGFGLDAAILWRGFGGERAEYRWRSPDGSEVLLLHLPPEGYCNALWLPLAPRAELRARGAALLAREAARSTTGVVLLMAGVDHVEPAPRLSELPDELAAAAGVSARLSSLPAYVAAVRAALARAGADGGGTPLACVSGELREGEAYANLLPGTLSTRSYLKRDNVRVESLLARVAEPLSALAWMLGEEYPRGLLDYAWRTLLQNHPHDSICGCSVDAVHDENLTRFARAAQTAEELATRALQALARRAEPAPAGALAALVVAPSAAGEAAVVSGSVDLPFACAEPGRSFDPALFETRLELFDVPELVAVRDASGAELPFQVLESEPALVHALSRYEPPLALHARRLRVAVWAPSLPGLGGMPLRLELGPGALRPAPLPLDTAPARAGRGWLDNGLVRLEARPDGTLEVLDRRSGRRLCGALAFVDEGDVGDTYNFSPPAEQRRVTSAEAREVRVAAVADGPLVASLHVTLELPLPPRASADRRSRATGEAPLAVRLAMALEAGSPRVGVHVRLDNRAENHRLRLLFPTGAERVETTRADTAFAVLERAARRPPPVGAVRETPVNAAPAHSVVDAGDATVGVSVWSEGLHEYEVVDAADGPALAITLLRCVGDLSRDDLATREGHAGPGLPTPGAQCPGRHEFRLAFEPRSGPPEPEALLAATARFLAPPRIVAPAGPVAGGAAAPGARLPPGALVRLESEPPRAAVLSALKKCESRESLVVRVFNARAAEVPLRLSACRPVREAYALDFREARFAPLEVRDAAARLTLRAAGIATVELVLD